MEVKDEKKWINHGNNNNNLMYIGGDNIHK
jgi:hypothetical protein